MKKDYSLIGHSQSYFAIREVSFGFFFFFFCTYSLCAQSLNSFNPQLQIESDASIYFEKIEETQDQNVNSNSKIYVNEGATLITSEDFQNVEIVVIETKKHSKTTLVKQSSQEKPIQAQGENAKVESVEENMTPIVIVRSHPESKSIRDGVFLERNLVPVNTTYLVGKENTQAAHTICAVVKKRAPSYDVMVDNLHFLNSFWARPPPSNSI